MRKLETKFAPLKLNEVAKDGSFSGYASLFGKVDLGGDVVVRGAFRHSLAIRPARQIKLLYQHDEKDVIGVWEEVRENADGLFVRGRILEDLARGREVLALMRAGALDGLSVGYKTVEARKDPATGNRLLHKVDLWEISVVTFPMLPEARIAEVKRHGAGGLPTPREIERLLTHDAGLSRTEARLLLKSGLGALAAKTGSGGDKALIARLEKAKHMMRAR